MSKIEWTDQTWNPVTGCTRVSPGCRNCYAMRQARRHDGLGRGYDGTTRSTESGPRWTGKVNLLPERLEQPLRWRKPRRVFVCSMSDLFHPDVPDEYIDRVFAVMARARDHTFQVLTKRPDRMLNWFMRASLVETSEELFNSAAGDWPLPNVWIATSVEDQERADERIPHLQRCPAAVRFLSCEPLLGPVDLVRHGLLPPVRVNPRSVQSAAYGAGEQIRPDWVIVGGESGPGARPMQLSWARSIRDQCREAGVPVFMKQLGSRPHHEVIDELELPLADRKGSDPSEWPQDLRIREWPDSGGEGS